MNIRMGKLEEAGKDFIRPSNYGNGIFLCNLLYIYICVCEFVYYISMLNWRPYCNFFTVYMGKTSTYTTEMLFLQR